MLNAVGKRKETFDQLSAKKSELNNGWLVKANMIGVQRVCQCVWGSQCENGWSKGEDGKVSIDMGVERNVKGLERCRIGFWEGDVCECMFENDLQAEQGRADRATVRTRKVIPSSHFVDLSVDRCYLRPLLQ